MSTKTPTVSDIEAMMSLATAIADRLAQNGKWAPLFFYIKYPSLFFMPLRRRMLWGASGLSFWLSDGLDKPTYRIIKKQSTKGRSSLLLLRGGPFSILYSLSSKRSKPCTL